MRKFTVILTVFAMCMFYVICPMTSFAEAVEAGEDTQTVADEEIAEENEIVEPETETEEAEEAEETEEAEEIAEPLGEEDDVDGGSHVTLEPGSDTDLAKFGINTCVTISKTGDYTLSGDTTHVRVEIMPSEGADIVVHFKDGLNINTGAFSNTGLYTSGIKVGEAKNATVKLSTCAGSYCQVSGYGSRPGIAKNGRDTKLIFDTDDHSNPGKMRVDAGTFGDLMKKNSPCGIGAEPSGPYTCGNMVFEAGTWNAYSHYAASIGASQGGSVNGLTINGGNINCSHGYGSLSSTAGPGIGVSDGGRLDNLVINGGTIKAYGRSADTGYSDNMDWAVGAGIGAGTKAKVGNITINGGRVYAYGGTTGADGASGIGYGEGATACSSITINGGYVEATGGWKKGGLHASNVTINGGEVKATGGHCGPGIRGTKVTITGGKVTATGGINVRKHFYDPVTRGGHGILGIDGIKITGGFIEASRGDEGNCGLSCNGIVIDGGYVKSTDNSKPVHNSDGEEVKETVFLLKNLDGSAASQKTVTSMTCVGETYDYGLKDVNSDSKGMLYFYLPADKKIKQTDTSDSSYFGLVSGGQNYNKDNTSVLTEGKRLGIWKTGTDSFLVQHASLGAGASKLTNIENVARGYKITDYALDSDGNNIIADKSGRLVANAKASDGSQLTNSEGEWTNTDALDNLSRLYANIEPVKYSVSFNSNRPEGATGQMQGEMEDQTDLIFDQKTKLNKNRFYLKGYIFKGWNTKANGLGIDIADEEEAYKLCSEDGQVCVLYAQWKPARYTITYNPGDGSGQTQTVDVDYDSPVTLKTFDQLGFNAPDGMKFVGWSNLALGHLYKDGYSGSNLCAADSEGEVQGYILTAEYIEDTHTMVAVNLDHQGVAGLDKKVKAIDGTTEYYLTEDKTRPGIYMAADIPAGEYDIEVEGYYTEGVRLRVGSESKTLYLDYYTVAVLGDAGINAKIGDNKAEMQVLDGISIDLAAKPDKADNGVGFDSWEILRGSNSNIDFKKASQQIKVEDTLTVFAKGHAARYTIGFEGNAPDKTASVINGHMDSVETEYGEEISLERNNYELSGYVFTGWNTKADGSGTAYSDKETIRNLTGTDGESVILYAQWEPISYTVEYDSNGGKEAMSLARLFMMSTASQEFIYDEPQTLKPCKFKREGYDFTGWNTEADGSGISFSDKEEVSNLSEVDNDTVVLYAQWKQVKPQPGPGPDPNDDPGNDPDPKTGDSSNVGLAAGIALLALAGIGVLVITRRKNK